MCMGNQNQKKKIKRPGGGTDANAKVGKEVLLENDLFASEVQATDPMSEEEFNAAYKERLKLKDRKSSSTFSVISPEKETDHKYEVFCNPNIKKYFEGTKTLILDTISFAKFVNVYKAQDASGLMAIKMINTGALDKDEIVKYENEIHLRQRLRNRHIISMIGAANCENFYFIRLELAERGDMRHILEYNGPIEEAAAIKSFAELCKALIFLNNRCIVHRSITVENILVTGLGSSKLNNFKKAISFSDRSVTLQHATGIDIYMSPEALEASINGKPYDPFQADLWSLGVCFFTMLNDCFPYRTRSNLPPNEIVQELLQEQKKLNLRWHNNLEEELSSEVKRLMVRILEPTSTSRHTLKSLRKEPLIRELTKKANA